MATVADIEGPEARGSGTGPPDRASSRPVPVRVCFVIDRLATGGTETQLLALIRNLEPDVVRPYLVLLDGADEISRAMEPTHCPVMRLGVKRLLTPRSIGKLLEFRRFLRRERIDVLQLYFPDSTYFGVLAGRLAGVRAIVRTRNNINHWMTPTHRLLGRLLNQLVTVTVCNSEAARQAVLADERPDPASVLVIENGVDLDRFAYIPPVSPGYSSSRPRRVGMVANLRPVKGVDVLVHAAARLAATHPDVTFHVAGEGPQRAELERLIDELDLTRRFVLHGKEADIPAFLAQLDIAVLCSRAEGMPNAVLEYMAAGRPIVATAVGGIIALIEDGVNGLLVPAGDPERLAEKLHNLLTDPFQAARLGAMAQRLARSRHPRRAMVHRLETLYGTVVRNRPGGLPHPVET